MLLLSPFSPTPLPPLPSLCPFLSWLFLIIFLELCVCMCCCFLVYVGFLWGGCVFFCVFFWGDWGGLGGICLFFMSSYMVYSLLQKVAA